MITGKLSKQIVWIQLISSFVIVFDYSFDYINFASNKVSFLDNLSFVITEIVRIGGTRIAMASFFAISGFLLFKDLKSYFHLKNGILKWYKNILVKRFRTLVVPYFLYNSIWTTFFWALSLFNLSDDFIFSFNNICAGVLFGKYNEVFWYIKVLIYFVIISPLFAYCYKYLNKWSLLLFVVLFSISDLSNSLGIVSLSNNFNGLFFFVMGGYLSLNKEIRSRITSRLFYLIISILVIYFLISYKAMNSEYVIVVNSLLLLFSLIGLLSYVKLTENLVDCKLPYISQFTFVIYALHKPILQAFNKILAKLFTPHLVIYLINSYFLPLLTIIFIYFFVRILDKFCNKLLLQLNGFRRWKKYE